MYVSRIIPALLLAVTTIVACSGPSKKELAAANTVRADSLFYLRNELLEQVMEGTRFVNEINKELAKARSINNGSPRELQPGAELADANDERRQVVARITRLVERLDAVQGRLAGMRKEVSDKDSTLKARIAEYDVMVADANQAAERQRLEFQGVIDGQTTQIVALQNTVDTLSGSLGTLAKEHNAVYFVAGTKAELLKKGILVSEGSKRFVVLGPKTVAPARDLDPSVFTRIDRMVDRTIILPQGEYKIVSRHNGTYTTAQLTKGGKVTGALTIDEPERFWNGSRFLILVRS